MKREAEANAEADKQKRELIDLKNRADAMVYQTRKSLDEHGDKVSSEVRGKIESALSNVEGKLKGDDKAAIEAALKELEAASMELGKVVYEQAKTQTAGSSTAENSTDESADSDDVVDAEFKVKED